MASNTQKKVKDLGHAVEEADWEFTTENTGMLTHEIHRYSGKYIPQIARQAIELTTFPGDVVLDPYVGSGTTLLEANLSGRHSIGIDLNPLAVLISEVKVTPLKPGQLSRLSNYFDGAIENISNYICGQETLISSNEKSKEFEHINTDPRLLDAWFIKWFNQRNLKELVALDYYIQSYPDEDARRIARVAFSNILRKSSNAHSGYPNVMLDKNKRASTSPLSSFRKALQESILSIEELESCLNANLRTEVTHGDATDLKLEDESVDAVITHPPYIGSIPYAEYGSLSLKWLGYEPKEIDRKLTGGKRQSKDVVERFMDGYRKMLSESYRVLRPKKYLFILIGDPTVKGEFIDLAQRTKELANEVGFNMIAEKKRTGVNRRANKMGAETLLFFQK